MAIFEQYGLGYPPEDLDREIRDPFYILMRNSALRREWNANRLAYAKSVLDQLEACLDRQPPERQSGHFIVPGDPYATPDAKAPRPSLSGRLTDDDLANWPNSTREN
jgi:hypothetical protein